MKKYTFSALFFALLFFFASSVFAVGTCPSINNHYGDLRVTTITCAADAANGSFPVATTPNIDGFFLGAIAIPGTTNPTALWDWTFTVNGGDVLGGKGANMSASAVFRTLPYDSTATAYVEAMPITGAGTLTATGNSVNSAQIVFKIFSSLKR